MLFPRRLLLRSGGVWGEGECGYGVGPGHSLYCTLPPPPRPAPPQRCVTGGGGVPSKAVDVPVGLLPVRRACPQHRK